MKIPVVLAVCETIGAWLMPSFSIKPLKLPEPDAGTKLKPVLIPFTTPEAATILLLVWKVIALVFAAGVARLTVKFVPELICVCTVSVP